MQRFKGQYPEINHRAKGSFTLETAYRGEAEACRALIIQPLAHLHGMLVHGYVRKPFADECWLVCTEGWPADWHIRTECWSIKALVCKPSGLALQAVTPKAIYSKHAFHGFQGPSPSGGSGSSNFVTRQ